MRIEAAQAVMIAVAGLFVALPPILLLRAHLRRASRRYLEAEAFATQAWAFSWIYLVIDGLYVGSMLLDDVPFWREPWAGPACAYPVLLWFYARSMMRSARDLQTQDMRRLWWLCEDELARLPGAAKAPPRPAAAATPPSGDGGSAARG